MIDIINKYIQNIENIENTDNKKKTRGYGFYIFWIITLILFLYAMWLNLYFLDKISLKPPGGDYFIGS